jgi:hemolysin activation/secretion protein
VELKTTSYLGKGALKGSQVSLKNEWFSFDKTGNDLYLSAQINAADNLLYGEQTLLGGETGLRGYPLGYQTGDKSALISAEKRFHFNWYPLHIAKFGAVAFADIGSAWGKGNKAHLLADVGIGLRIVPTRSSSAKIFHFDLAFPLIDQDKVDKYQFVVKTSYSF